jgi:putative transcriptional regulator
VKNVKFKELRQRGGYTQAALGQILGITPDYVNIIENGRQTPGFVLAKRIADFFGVTVDELFFCEPNERNVQKIAKDCTYGRCCYEAKFSSCKDAI